MEKVILSFPGLGIDEFTINKIAFSIGDKIQVRWYAICIVLGILVAYFYACFRAKTNGLTSDDMTDVALATIICGVIGARVYYVLSKLDTYTNFWDVFKIWEGGIAIYGALIGGGLALFICCLIKKINWRAVFDTAAPGVLIAQGIGRWGNFFNGEAYGVAPAEGSFLWFTRMTVQQQGWGTQTLATPCFFYESMWCILGFILINLFYKKFKRYDGQIFFEYMIWYSFGRMFIEGLRTDSLYLFNNENLPRKSQLLAFILVIAGVICMIVFGLIARKKKLEAAAEDAPAGAYDEILADMKAADTPADDGTPEEIHGCEDSPVPDDPAVQSEEFVPEDENAADGTAEKENAEDTAQESPEEEKTEEEKNDAGTDN